jgi:hypothetical protein
VRSIPLLIALALLAGGSYGCAKAQAHIEPIMPMLTPPPPPPRMVEIYNHEPIATVEPSPLETALVTPPTRTPARPPAPRVDVPTPEPLPIEPERRPQTTSALTLKPMAGAEEKTQVSIRALLDRASRDLQRVNYAALNADGRAQYDTARRFMQQADEALKTANVAFAGKLADKAATMAAILVR